MRVAGVDSSEAACVGKSANRCVARVNRVRRAAIWGRCRRLWPLAAPTRKGNKATPLSRLLLSRHSFDLLTLTSASSSSRPLRTHLDPCRAALRPPITASGRRGGGVERLERTQLSFPLDPPAKTPLWTPRGRRAAAASATTTTCSSTAAAQAPRSPRPRASARAAWSTAAPTTTFALMPPPLQQLPPMAGPRGKGPTSWRRPRPAEVGTSATCPK